MINGTTQSASESMYGQLHGNAVEFSGVSTDTRDIKKGELFFCLMGQRNGHEFARQALDKGAAAVVIDKNHPMELGPRIVVEDTLQALGDLAHAWRKEFSIPILAVGGSNGKTTAKELIRAVLNTKFKVLATEGNLNNLIGVPKTLFRLSKEHEIAVIEAGMNDFGELARLTEIIEPTAGLLTNIGMEHLEKLKNLEGVAKAEGELFAGLSSQATAIINLTDPWIVKLKTPAQKLLFGTPETPVWGEVLNAQFEGDRPLHLAVHIEKENARLSLKLPGPHNLSNVLAALICGYHFGVTLEDAKEALEAFVPAPSRMQLVELKGGRRLIDDCYNANPSSTMASLSTLARLKKNGESLAILGEMLELGDYTVAGHRQVGQKAAEEKIDRLIAIGPHAQDILQGAEKSGMSKKSLRAFVDADAAVQSLQNIPEEVQWILVKGSRGIHLEKVVRFLKDNF